MSPLVPTHLGFFVGKGFSWSSHFCPLVNHLLHSLAQILSPLKRHIPLALFQVPNFHNNCSRCWGCPPIHPHILTTSGPSGLIINPSTYISQSNCFSQLNLHCPHRVDWAVLGIKAQCSLQPVTEDSNCQRAPAPHLQSIRVWDKTQAMLRGN